MKPTIGRIVHCFLDRLGVTVTLAAIITAINDKGHVMLTIFTPDGPPLVQQEPFTYSETPQPGCWTWPPRA